MSTEVLRLRERHQALFDDIERDLAEYRSYGTLSRAQQLSRATGQQLNAQSPPQYFTGDLDAETVLVHLNPGGDLPVFDDFDPFASIEAYYDFHRRFGEHMYGQQSDRKHVSRFDSKQVRFLREFGVMSFVDERTEDDRYANLVRVLDDKLQLEMVPYSSSNFDLKGFSPDILRPLVFRLLDVIDAAPRKHVLFCSRVFERVLGQWVTQEHYFHLEKKDGTPEKMRSRFANLEIRHNGRIIQAGLCHSWPRQGLPMSSYGREVAIRY